MNKKRAQMRHARRRAKQRYGLDLSTDQLRAIANRIKDGRASLLRSCSNRVGIYQVPYQQQLLVVAYDRKRGQVSSFLPPNSWEVGT